MRLERAAAVVALVAAGLVAAMIAVGLFRGVTQEFFEQVHPLAETTQRLLRDGPVLRLVFLFDNLFLIAYSLFFLLFALARRREVQGVLLWVGTAAMLLTGLLDSLENQHIVTLLNQVEQGLPLTAGQLVFQAVESQVKFGVSYFGVVLFALAFPRKSLLEKAVARGTGLVYPLLGAAALSAPAGMLAWLGLGRVLFFLVGFVASAFVLWQRGGAPADQAGAAGVL